MADTTEYRRHHTSAASRDHQPHARTHAAHIRTPAAGAKTNTEQLQATPQQPQTLRERVNPYLTAMEGAGVTRRKKRRRGLRVVIPALIALVLILGGAGLAIHFVRNPPIFDITVNGESHRVDRGITVAGCVNAGFASPLAGNLLAIDGSVITEGGGERFSALLNDREVGNPGTRLHPGDVLIISDGGDTTEEFTETSEEIPFNVTEFEATQGDYYIGSIHAYSAGEPGELVTRTGSLSGVTLTEVTREPIDAGVHFYDANVGDAKLIALTFDDGPWPTTGELLDVLKEYGVHATFFTIGNQVATYSEFITREEAEGHQIATHTWDHASGSGQGVNLTYMSPEEQVDEVERGFEALEEALGHDVPRVLRAPGGNFYGSLIDNLSGHITAEIGWNVDTLDWSRPGVDAIVEAMLSVQPGQVILCHDGGGPREQTIEAVRIAIPQLLEQGYQFVTIDELMAYEPTASDEA